MLILTPGATDLGASWARGGPEEKERGLKCMWCARNSCWGFATKHTRPNDVAIALILMTFFGNGENSMGEKSVKVFLTGIGCVGKTTIGSKLAELLSIHFFDLDLEIEAFFGTSIERLQNRFLTVHSYRTEAAKALVHLLKCPDAVDSVIALPPSGLMGAYLRAVRKSKGTIVVLNDKPENILERITFYDTDSKPIKKRLTPREKRLYLKAIKEDITYFRKTYERAHIQIDISDLCVGDAASKVQVVLEAFHRAAEEQSNTG